MTVPHWRRSVSPPRTMCDAVVIGAGITGVAAALAMERRGLDVRVLERHTTASGASSRNAGFLMRGCADHYADACERYGRDRARALWEITEENLRMIRAEGAGELASFRETPSCLLALDDAQEQALAQSGEMLRADGFDAPWITRGNDSAWTGPAARTLRGGLVNPGDASVNPCDLMSMLAGKLRRPIMESREVFAIQEGARDGSVEVVCADEVFVSPRVMVCTNAYAPLVLRGLAGLVTPRRGQMIAVRYPPAACIRLGFSYYFNHGSEYFRQTPDGTVVFGGCRTYHAEREVGYEDATTPWVQADIERWLQRLLGEGYEVTARWAGTMGFSPDGLPLVGPVPSNPSGPAGGRVWFCGGFTGHGMSMGFKTAHLAVGAMLDGGDNPFDITRFSAGD